MPAGPRAGPPGRALRKAPPTRRAGLSGAPERAATRPGPRRRRFGAGNAPPMAKNHRNRKGRGPRPLLPPGKRLVPKPLFRPRRAAGREPRCGSSDFGDFLPKVALVSVKPGLIRTHALLAPSRTPPVRRPTRPPPDGSGASEASGRFALGGADLAYSNLGLT